MARMKTKLSFLSIAFLFFLDTPIWALSCDEHEPAFTHQSLLTTLRRDGFPDVMLDNVRKLRLKRMGSIKVSGATCFTLFVYTAEFDNGPGTDTHAVARLLVIKNMNYAGMYPIDTLPIGVSGNTVNFPGEEKWGNKIVFDKEQPPQQIHLNGEFRALFNKPRSPMQKKTKSE